jgi:hypothetical protein
VDEVTVITSSVLQPNCENDPLMCTPHGLVFHEEESNGYVLSEDDVPVVTSSAIPVQCITDPPLNGYFEQVSVKLNPISVYVMCVCLYLNMVSLHYQGEKDQEMEIVNQANFPNRDMKVSECEKENCGKTVPP